ncbi:MAG: hypothetical protein JXB23_08505 [Candidatus Aminicenantes bacterium]|nr:hypothetical protein [Candidatus Aminicenantes bacterium]
MMKILLILLTGLMTFPLDVEGLRNLKIGDKFPSTEAMSVFVTGENKLILVMNSGRDRNAAFFRELVPELQESGNLEFYLVDTGQEPNSQIMSAFESLEIKKKYVSDADRKIYGEMGIIVLPTLLLVTKDNVLHSFIAGHRSNLELIFQSHIEALIKGEVPEELAHKTERMKEERTVGRMLEQGFRLMISRNYELAHKTFAKALAVDPEEETAKLGIGYALLFMGKIDESLQHFSELKEKMNSRRVQLGYYLCEALKAPAEESLEQIATLSQLEPQLFFVVFKVADTLDTAGKCEESKQAFRHAYEVLLRMYRK